MSEFTKGPWRVGEIVTTVVADHPVSLIPGSDDLQYYGGHLIAESVSFENAHLIAAAPELYAFIRKEMDETVCICKFGEWTTVSCTHCQAKALIAKAEAKP